MLTIVPDVLLRSGPFTVIRLIIGCSINRHARRVMRRNCKDCVTRKPSTLDSGICHPCSEQCYNCVTPPRGLIEILGQKQVRQVIIRLTNAERDTILAALRRWQSYPAAREADSIATNGGRHRPLDNAEIERICKRITKIERKRDAAPLLRQSNNGARKRKASDRR
jgi:hypothetical protein